MRLNPLRIQRLALFAATIAAFSPASGQTGLEELRVSPDRPLAGTLASGTAFGILDTGLLQIDPSGVPQSTETPFPGLEGNNVDAHHFDDGACGPSLYSLDNPAEIGATVFPADVIAADGTIVLDAGAAAIPRNVDIDAISRDPIDCDLLVSFDKFVMIAGTSYAADDVVRFADGSLSLFVSLDSGHNLDALHALENGALLVSFATGGSVDSGTAFRDSDVLEFSDGHFVLNQSLADQDSQWERTGVDSLWALRAPQPGQIQWPGEAVTVWEDTGTASFEVERTGGADGSVSVDWSTVSSSATAGDDFVTASDTLVFADGQTVGTVEVTLIDDSETEGPESFFIDLESASGGATLGSPQRLTVNIRDDEDFLFADGFE